MEVKNYTFQSPYPSPVQVGRPDPSTKKEDTSTEDASTKTTFIEPVSTNETLQAAQSLESSLKSDVTPTLNTLDTYA